MTNTDTPRIYVACLASYNAGILHGEWVDVEGDEDGNIDDLWASVAHMLRESPEPNIMRYGMVCEECDHVWDVGYDPAKTCPECDGTDLKVSESYPSAEEWAIHDYEGFGGYPVSEGENLSDLIQHRVLVVACPDI